MRLNKLTLRDKKVFKQFLNLNTHELSVYAFENIYIWKGLFDINWMVLEDNLCIFFRDKVGSFLYLAPLGNTKNPEVTKKAFEIMDKFNKNKEISRIENIGEKDVYFYRGLGLDCRIKSYDYLCLREDLANLKGNKFKSKRACFNYFTRHYVYEYLPFALRYRNDCLKLYNLWREGRRRRNQNHIYQGMLDDSLSSLVVLLNHYRKLDIIGRVVKIDKEIKAFTFGFKLNPHTFCVLYEITDLSIRGLAQFIFRSCCEELKDYKYINIMDDCGLANLKQVKLSYRPARLLPAYIAKRKSE